MLEFSGQHHIRVHGLVVPLTDVVLPLMSGRTIADRVRSMRPDTKVLFMSGYTDDAIVQHGILHSGVAYFRSRSRQHR